MRHECAPGMGDCFENRGSLGARASSPAGVFKNGSINNNTTEASNALLFREAVRIGPNPAGETPALPVKTIFMHSGAPKARE
jgi:hypothetical protein